MQSLVSRLQLMETLFACITCVTMGPKHKMKELQLY